MLERVQAGVVAATVAEQFQSAVGDDLVGVHVRRGPRSTLDDVDDELVVPSPGLDLVTGGHDRAGALGLEQAESLVGARGSEFDAGQRDDQLGITRYRDAGDREVLQRTRGVHAVVHVIGHLVVAEQIVFQAELHRGHVHSPFVPSSRCCLVAVLVAASSSVSASACAPSTTARSAAADAAAAANSGWWLTAGSESMPMYG